MHENVTNDQRIACLRVNLESRYQAIDSTGVVMTIGDLRLQGAPLPIVVLLKTLLGDSRAQVAFS